MTHKAFESDNRPLKGEKKGDFFISKIADFRGMGRGGLLWFFGAIKDSQGLR